MKTFRLQTPWNRTYFLWLTHTAGDWDRYTEWAREQLVLYCTEIVTLVQDRERNLDPLFPIVLVQFPVPLLVMFPCLSIQVLLHNSLVVATIMCQSRQSLLIAHSVHERISTSTFRWLAPKKWYGKPVTLLTTWHARLYLHFNISSKYDLFNMVQCKPQQQFHLCVPRMCNTKDIYETTGILQNAHIFFRQLLFEGSHNVYSKVSSGPVDLTEAVMQKNICSHIFNDLWRKSANVNSQNTLGLH